MANQDLNIVYAMNLSNKTQIVSCLVNLKNCKTKRFTHESPRASFRIRVTLFMPGGADAL